MIDRFLNLSRILGDQNSALLFGPRGTGKTHLIKHFLATRSSALTIDLLDPREHNRYLLNPAQLIRDVEGVMVEQRDTPLLVCIDEVQKVPQLLDEVHLLLERFRGRVQFLLTGSSARKLKRVGVNLLAGRAWTLKLHPFTTLEMEIDLGRALQFGTLPMAALASQRPFRYLESYCATYLQEEIQQEALVRNVQAFHRFLEVAAQMNGTPVQYAKVARDCHVAPNTVRDYFDILVDTYLAFRLEPWSYSVRTQLRTNPKYYLFDTGVLNTLRGELRADVKVSGFRTGSLFESFMVTELIRLNDYFETGFKFYHWRTDRGKEVDCVLSRGPSDQARAIELKNAEAPSEFDLAGLTSFADEHPTAALYCLCRTPRPYKLGKIDVLPWREGLRAIFERA